jgi:hypothetical protein
MQQHPHARQRELAALLNNWRHHFLESRLDVIIPEQM